MGPIGFTILGIYLLALVGIGYVCSRKQEDIADFFVAGRSIPAWAAMIAIVATETSAITFIGAPAISFAEGGDFSFLMVAFGYIIARIFLAFLILPKFFERDLVTIYEFLGYRFGRAAQRTSGIFFFITRALAAGVRHYAAALVLSSITTMDLTLAIIITGFVSLIYSILGGLSAVIWTEVVQFGIMILGSILAFFYLLNVIPGGWNEVVQLGSEAGKFTLFHWHWGEGAGYSFFLGVASGFALSLASHGADQDTVQRLLSCKGLNNARIAIIGSGFVVFVQFAFFLLIGVMLFAFYKELPSELQKADELLPFFVANELPQVAAALVIAAVLSAALSSTASALNSLSSTSVNDFLLPWFNTKPDNRVLVAFSRGFTLIWTLILVGIAALARNSEYILDTGLSIPSYTYGSLLAAFLLGIFTPLRNQLAMIIGMILGVIMILILAYNGVHWNAFVPAGTLTSMISALVIEAILGRTQGANVT